MIYLMHESFSLLNGSRFGKNVIIFSAEMSSLVRIDNKKKDILILAKVSIDGSDDITLTVD